MRYALHYATHMRMGSNKQALSLQLLEHRLPLIFEATAPVIHVDGDSFLEWGEPLADPDANGHHVVLEYSADSDAQALQRGEVIYHLLTRARYTSPIATCHADHHVPFAISSAEVWSGTLTPTGERRGDWPG